MTETTTDDPEDIPTEEIDLAQQVGTLDKNLISAGSGSCPAPKQITVLDNTVEVSYEPFCELAQLLEYVFIAFGGIWAAAILYKPIVEG